MLRNYFLIAIRSLRRYASFSILNIVGLSVSMSVALLLILFLREQGSKDSFHEDSSRIYRVYSDFKSAINDDNALYATSPADLADALRESVPGIELISRVRKGFGGTVSHGGTALPIRGFYGDNHFFDLFSFRLSSGNPAVALSTPYSVVLSRATAEKFFGDADPVGEVLTVEGQGEFTVTGLLDRDDYKTHFPLSAIASYATLENDPETVAMLGDWTRSIYRSFTYAKLATGVDASSVQEILDTLLSARYAERDNNILVRLALQPVTGINLGSIKGNELGAVLPAAVALFLSFLAFVILMTACFNYVGLTVSRSLKRAREVGVRKMFGAGRRQVFVQFMVEALVISTISVVGALGLLTVLLPAFNSLMFVNQIGAHLTIGFGSDPGIYVVFLIFTLVIASIAGIYPALYLSRFSTAEAVKGMAELDRSRGSWLRKGLVVIQFTLSVVFIITTLTMYRQADYMVNADYGFEQKDILNVNLFSVPYPNFRDALVSSPHVRTISGTSPLPASGSRQDRWLKTPDMENPVKGYSYDIDENLVDNIGLTLLAGRTLSEQFAEDLDENVIVNETVLNKLNLGAPDEALDKIFVMGDSTRLRIVGVVRNYQSDVMSDGNNAVVLQLAPDQIRWANVKIVPGHLKEAVADIQAAWSRLGNARALEYEAFESQVKNNVANLMVKDALRMVGFVSILAIIIACLGLLGIASFNVESRTREISIRKVVGAGVGDILGLLSREFLILMSAALVVALPLSWIVASSFLDSFANSVELGLGVFVLGTSLILVLAFVVTGSQTVQAALENPVENLHME